MSFWIEDRDVDLHLAYWKRRLIKQMDKLELEVKELELHAAHDIVTNIANDLRIALIKDTNHIISEIESKIKQL